MNLTGKVTVLMPVYNSEENLLQSVNSILDQTYTDFKFLIINDGSTDNSAEIIHNINDERIVFLENEKNLGIVKTLNRGLNLIESDYIVRMDSDDTAYPDRLEKQIHFMDENPSVAVSGTAVKIYSEETTKTKKRKVKTKPSQIRSELFFNTSHLHPTVIMRNSIIQKEGYRYSQKYKHSEDYGLWQEISLKYDLANLPDVLLMYQDHESSITNQADRDLKERDRTHILIYNDYMQGLGIKLTQLELAVWRRFNSGRLNMKDEKTITALNQLISKIKAPIDWMAFDEPNFDKRASFRFRTCAKSSNLSIKDALLLYRNYIDSFEFDKTELLKFYAKNLIKR